MQQQAGFLMKDYSLPTLDIELKHWSFVVLTSDDETSTKATTSFDPALLLCFAPSDCPQFTAVCQACSRDARNSAVYLLAWSWTFLKNLCRLIKKHNDWKELKTWRSAKRLPYTLTVQSYFHNCKYVGEVVGPGFDS